MITSFAKTILGVSWLRFGVALILAGVPVLHLADVAPAPQPSIAVDGPRDPRAVAAFFDALIAQQLEEEHVAGATVAVVHGNDVVFANGYGYADVERRRPVEVDRTLFHIGSDGKLFTWTAVMQLVEQGRLDLHTDVNAYLDFAIPATFAQPITLHHLLTHTAGFEEELRTLQVPSARDLLPLQELVTRSVPKRVYPPGAVFAYSNYGTTLAGYIVERVSGEPYAQYISAHILQPLDMSHSGLTQPLAPELMADMSLGYHYRNGRYEPTAFEWMAAPPAAALRTTATDIAHFMIAHLNDGRYGAHQLLQSTTVQTMHQQQFTHHPQLSGFAYGFAESRENNQRVLWHVGESAHFATMLALLPEHHVGFFVSYNTRPVDTRRALSAFLDHYYPLPITAVQPPLPDASTRAAHVAGTYVSTRVAHTTAQKLGHWEEVTVQVNEDGSLVMGPQRYIEVSPGVYKQVDGERMMTFREDADGRVTHLFWGVQAFFRVPWYHTLGVHLLLWAMSVTVLLTASVAWLIAALVRWRRGGVQQPSAARTARWLAAVFALSCVGTLTWLALALLRYGDTFIYPATTMTYITGLTWLLLVLGIGVVGFAVVAWQRRFWNLVWRVHYTLVATTGAVLLWSLDVWNLFRFGT